jgi:hypothetical protein
MYFFLAHFLLHLEFSYFLGLCAQCVCMVRGWVCVICVWLVYGVAGVHACDRGGKSWQIRNHVGWLQL